MSFPVGTRVAELPWREFKALVWKLAEEWEQQ
jgi:hypothetical protein